MTVTIRRLLVRQKDKVPERRDATGCRVDGVSRQACDRRKMSPGITGGRIDGQTCVNGAVVNCHASVLKHQNVVSVFAYRPRASSRPFDRRCSNQRTIPLTFFQVVIDRHPVIGSTNVGIASRHRQRRNAGIFVHRIRIQIQCDLFVIGDRNKRLSVKNAGNLCLHGNLLRTIQQSVVHYCHIKSHKRLVDWDCHKLRYGDLGFVKTGQFHDKFSRRRFADRSSNPPNSYLNAVILRKGIRIDVDSDGIHVDSLQCHGVLAKAAEPFTTKRIEPVGYFDEVAAGRQMYGN